MMFLKSKTGFRPHPAHAILLAFPIALFSSALVTDVAYLRTAEVQWANFSAWLIAGALVFGGLVLLWAVIALFARWRRSERSRRIAYVGVLAAMWVLGFINSLKHSQDGWFSVQALGLILSVVCTLLALAAAYIAFSGAEREVVA